jgi:hypothetical protein
MGFSTGFSTGWGEGAFSTWPGGVSLTEGRRGCSEPWGGAKGGSWFLSFVLVKGFLLVSPPIWGRGPLPCLGDPPFGGGVPRLGEGCDRGLMRSDRT